ncbi:hypothetical protein ASE01_05605 [Nocardioides sp. Root190]|uniref:hypothetical protein n=1 Tax=Nocardioides sp. Root190 TaxID=1736488 RepID=UPI0006FA8981|nr:hypothetical protein [Nocardioides sp. Root190]KRB77678.1 hypothetical protein ASE01_05605 [Nocardioides sp. Root190]
MGSNDEFGPDTETIRAWLNKRATYAKDARVIGAPRGGSATAPATAAPAARTTSLPSASPSSPSPVEDSAPADTPARSSVPRPDTNDAGRSVLAALGNDEPAPAAPAAPAARTSSNATAAGRSVVEALRADPPPSETRSRARTPRSEPTPPTRRPAPAPEPPSRAPVARTENGVRISAPASRSTYEASNRPPPEVVTRPQVQRGRWTEPEENLTASQASTDVDFPVRGGVRRALSLVLLASLAATGVMSYVASQDRAPSSIGIAGVLGFLTLTVWAVRAGCVTTELSLRRGQLTIKRAGRSEVVDIGSPHTPVAIVGEPGHRRWTVLLERPGLPLIVVNASIVDPHWFTSAIYRLRPELRPGYDGADDYADSVS